MKGKKYATHRGPLLEVEYVLDSVKVLRMLITIGTSKLLKVAISAMTYDSTLNIFIEYNIILLYISNNASIAYSPKRVTQRFILRCDCAVAAALQ